MGNLSNQYELQLEESREIFFKTTDILQRKKVSKQENTMIPVYSFYFPNRNIRV